MNVYRTAIVDDEPLARRSLRNLLGKHPEISIVAECRNGMEAISVLNSQPIDIVFLDIQMPQMDGFEVLTKVLNRPVVVFVTAFDQFAIKAFEVHAIDYLLKPVEEARFEQTLARAICHIETSSIGELERRLVSLLAGREADREVVSPAYTERLAVGTGTRMSFVPVEAIDYIEANDYYAAVHVGTKTHLIRETMKDLEARLDPSRFVRIHRSVVVNISRVRELQRGTGTGFTAILEGGASLPLSRSRWEAVRKRLSS